MNSKQILQNSVNSANNSNIFCEFLKNSPDFCRRSQDFVARLQAIYGGTDLILSFPECLDSLNRVRDMVGLLRDVQEGKINAEGLLKDCLRYGQPIQQIKDHFYFLVAESLNQATIDEWGEDRAYYMSLLPPLYGFLELVGLNLHKVVKSHTVADVMVTETSKMS